MAKIVKIVNSYITWDDGTHEQIISFAAAEAAAAVMETETGNVHLAVDRGDWVSPRYTVIEGWKVGDDVSMGFNGDYYPVGKVTKIGKGQKFITVDGPRGEKKFARRRLSESWRESPGGGFCLVHGIHSELNPSF